MLHNNLDILVEAENEAVFKGGIPGGQPCESNNKTDKAVSASEATPDVVGAGGSFLCLLHCLAPQLVTLGILGSGVAQFFSSEYWAVFFWITCIWAVRKSAGETRFPFMKILLWLSFLIFSLGMALEMFAETGKWISYIGSFMLMISHIWSFRLHLTWSALRRKILHSACSETICKA